MGLFGSKATTSSGSTLPSQGTLNIQKIPDIFYGGSNPVIYEQQSRSDKVSGTSREASLAVSKPSSATSATGRKSRMVWTIAIAGILVTGGVSAYYIIQYRSATQPSQRTVSVTTPGDDSTLPVISSTTSTISAATTTAIIISSTTPSLTSNFLEFPPINLGSTADVDLDQLTDIEEATYGIDSGTWDTDSDGYYDGQEIVNLYNPRGFAPVKLIDSGLVLEYVNPFSEYRVYYPIGWQKGSVDPGDRHVLFSTISGEFVEVRVFEKTPDVTFSTWFERNAPQEQFNLLTPFTNRFGFEGWKRNDGLVIYFDTSSYIFVLIYRQSDNRSPIPYRSTLEMMYQSFRPTATNRTIPEQTLLEIPSDVLDSSGTDTSVIVTTSTNL